MLYKKIMQKIQINYAKKYLAVIKLAKSMLNMTQNIVANN